MKQRHAVLLLALLAAGCTPGDSPETTLTPAAGEKLVKYHVPGMD